MQHGNTGSPRYPALLIFPGGAALSWVFRPFRGGQRWLACFAKTSPQLLIGPQVSSASCYPASKSKSIPPAESSWANYIVSRGRPDVGLIVQLPSQSAKSFCCGNPAKHKTPERVLAERRPFVCLSLPWNSKKRKWSCLAYTSNICSLKSCGLCDFVNDLDRFCMCCSRQLFRNRKWASPCPKVPRESSTCN